MEVLWVVTLAIAFVVALAVLGTAWAIALYGVFGRTIQAYAGFAAIGICILILTALPLGIAVFLFSVAFKLLSGT